MILPESRTLTWIEKVARENNVKDIALAEKAIRAFSLLEALVRSGCPLLFKGGTAEMLHLNSAKRLSIDVDIICPIGTKLEDYLKIYATEYGFGDVELVDRISRTDTPKKHAKYYYQVSYPAGGRQDKILLDVLFEENHYSHVVSLPIESPFLKTDGDPIMVNLPSIQDMLGDKVRGFIHSEKNYGLDHAIVNASKTAYLSKLVEKGVTETHHFFPGNEQQLTDTVIMEPLPTKFNKFKKSNIEAFFYWSEIQKLMM